MPGNQKNSRFTNKANSRNKFFSDKQALECSLDSEQALSFDPTTGGSNLACGLEEESNPPVKTKLNLNIPYETIGAISRYYETGKRTDLEAAAIISSGKKDPGGKSYGIYQLASKTKTLQEFLSTSHYEDYFKDKEVGSKEFDDQWKTLVSSDSNFISAQHEFIGETHYKPVAIVAASEGLPITLAVQSALWSMSVQHGKASQIVKNAVNTHLDPSNKEDEGSVVKALYEARTKYVKSLKLEAEADILKRYSREIKDVLKLVELVCRSPNPTLVR